MPQELVDTVLDEMTDTESTMCLALTCSYFFRMLAARVQLALKAEAAPWAGDRLMLIGDRARSEPANLLTPQDIESVNSKLRAHLQPGWRLFVLAQLFRRAGPNSTPSRMRSNRSCLFGLSYLDGSESAQYDRLLNIIRQDTGNTNWILRNHTLKHYVSEAALKKYRSRYMLEDVIFGFASWSDPVAASYCDARDYGIWSGHCVDITTLEDLKGHALNSMEWKDVSESAIERISRTI